MDFDARPVNAGSPVQAHPYDGHLGAAVRVQGHQVREGRGLQHGPGAVGLRRHEATLAASARRSASKAARKDAGASTTSAAAAIATPRRTEVTGSAGAASQADPLSGSAARRRPACRGR